MDNTQSEGKRKLITLIPTGGRLSEDVHKDIDAALQQKKPELYQQKKRNDNRKNSWNIFKEIKFL